MILEDNYLEEKIVVDDNTDIILTYYKETDSIGFIVENNQTEIILEIKEIK